jgi:hypothetical protein
MGIHLQARTNNIARTVSGSVAMHDLCSMDRMGTAGHRPLMRKILNTLLLLLAVHMVQAQALLVLPQAEEPLMPHFNEQFIARNGITAIHGELMLKKDNEPMRTKKEKYLYRFDEQGRMIYRNSSFGQPGTGRDTAQIFFNYDDQGNVTSRLRNDLNGYFAYEIERDDKGRPVRETYSRIDNLNTDRYQLIPGSSTEISDEQFRYSTVNDTVQKKTYINALGLPFREQTHAWNKLGYLLSIEDRYLVSNRRSRINFYYDDNGRLAERVDQPDLNKDRKTRRIWRYDTAGNVTEAELWHDDIHVEREEYMYEEKTMMLKARLTKNIATNAIGVVKFHTETGQTTVR